ncbi:hypothetical protein BOTCAL_0020g00370 [Botryotinia calthae]|uniref:Uncharacterized protein n=1 Tax=Botryotinia calthae TaxID=38488 RepID=A0A4Y8DF09_9HELO|nr:hypothetical protein BOTCAL_0020g00370 [Botryotinia calthae]
MCKSTVVDTAIDVSSAALSTDSVTVANQNRRDVRNTHEISNLQYDAMAVVIDHVLARNLLYNLKDEPKWLKFAN